MEYELRLFIINLLFILVMPYGRAVKALTILIVLSCFEQPNLGLEALPHESFMAHVNEEASMVNFQCFQQRAY